MMQANRTHRAGFTLVEVLIVSAIVALMAAIAIPNFVRARTSGQTSTCITNLKQIEAAIVQWALEEKKGASEVVTLTDISGGPDRFIKPLINSGLQCPAGGIYTLTEVETLPVCSLAAFGHSL